MLWDPQLSLGAGPSLRPGAGLPGSPPQPSVPVGKKFTEATLPLRPLSWLLHPGTTYTRRMYICAPAHLSVTPRSLPASPGVPCSLSSR